MDRAPHPWPQGDTEMAGRIRSLDWASTPLGPPADWPSSLRVVLDLILVSDLPMAILWGRDLRLLYNDAYRGLMGYKHPQGLGEPTQDIWSEVWDRNAPMFARVLGGETVSGTDTPYQIMRSGTLEEASFTFSCSPIRAETGTIAGILLTLVETTDRLRAERTLTASEARYRALATASADVIYRMSADWREMHQLDGRGVLADLLESSATWLDTYIALEDQPQVSAVIAEAVHTGTPFELEHRVRHLDGASGWTHSRAVPVRDDHGMVAEWIGAASDVTDRKQATEALRASEARLATLLENLPDYAIFLVDPAGIITEWTEGAQRVKGYPAEEVIGRHFELFYTPEDQAARLPDQELAEAARTGRYEGEGWRVRKGGEHFWGNEIATAVRDEAGTLVGFTKIARDLTERMQAEARLAESEERYRRIVEQATDYAIFSTDPQRRIESWSPGAEAIFGWTADEAIGQLSDMTYTPEDQAAAIPAQEAAHAQVDGQAPNVRWHRRQDDRRVFIDGMAYARRGPDGSFQGVFKVGQDVTERMRDEATRREDETTRREDLEAEVAGANLNLRALSRRLLLVQEEERRRLALELHDEIGQVLTGLTFQIAAAQGQNGAAALAEANITVQQLAEQVRQLALELRPQVLDRYGLFAAVQWHVERYQATTGITVHLWEHEVAQRRYAPEIEIAAFRVVQEALTNIARYAEVTEAWVTLFGDGSLLVSIHDQGCGFAPDQSRESSGVGGMRERVALLGGTFDLETAPGNGVHITADFPLEDEDLGEKTVELAAATEETAS